MAACFCSSLFPFPDLPPLLPHPTPRNLAHGFAKIPFPTPHPLGTAPPNHQEVRTVSTQKLFTLVALAFQVVPGLGHRSLLLGSLWSHLPMSEGVRTPAPCPVNLVCPAL